jgi:hypothetical protein
MQQQEKYLNADIYKDEEGKSVSGFLEIAVEDTKAKLLVKEDLKLKKANYVATVDMGSREDKLVKEESYYMAKNGILYKFTAKKDKNLSLFGDMKEEMKKYIDARKLKFNNRLDLMDIVKHYNSL